MTTTRLLHDLLILRSAPGEQDRIAVVTRGRSYTYHQLIDSSQRLAAALLTSGVKRGDRIAIFLENSWESAVSIFGTLLAGAVFILISPQTKSEKLRFILSDSGSRAIIAENHLGNVLRSATASLDIPPFSLIVGDPHDSTPNSFFHALNSATPLATVATIPLDLAAILYTSGSTGNPKGVMLTHQAMVFTVWSLVEYLKLNREDRILCALPISFDYGLYQLLMAVALGACLILDRSFIFLGKLIEQLHSEQITVFPAVPTVFANLIAAHRRNPMCFPHITRVTNTAAALPDDFVPPLRELFPNALIYKMYGLTECKRVSYLSPEFLDAKPGSVGKPIPGTEVYLLSTDGTTTPTGEIGTLHVRGPHVMAGYWNRPDLTEQMLKPGKLPGERILCTHDLFRMDDEGFLYFVARSDEIIKCRGQKVSPIEVENALHRIPGIVEAAVVGVPDPLHGEAIRAYVVVSSSAQLTTNEIRKSAALLLEPHMIPSQLILCTKLPRTSNGKIAKRKLSSSLIFSTSEPRTSSAQLGQFTSLDVVDDQSQMPDE